MGWLRLNRVIDPTVSAHALGASPSKAFWLRCNALFLERKRKRGPGPSRIFLTTAHI